MEKRAKEIEEKRVKEIVERRKSRDEEEGKFHPISFFPVYITRNGMDVRSSEERKSVDSNISMPKESDVLSGNSATAVAGQIETNTNDAETCIKSEPEDKPDVPPNFHGYSTQPTLQQSYTTVAPTSQQQQQQFTPTASPSKPPQQNYTAPPTQSPQQNYTSPPNQLQQQQTAPPNQSPLQNYTAPPSQAPHQNYTSPPNQQLQHYTAPPSQALQQNYTAPPSQAPQQNYTAPPSQVPQQNYTAPPNQQPQHHYISPTKQEQQQDVCTSGIPNPPPLMSIPVSAPKFITSIPPPTGNLRDAGIDQLLAIATTNLPANLIPNSGNNPTSTEFPPPNEYSSEQVLDSSGNFGHAGGSNKRLPFPAGSSATFSLPRPVAAQKHEHQINLSNPMNTGFVAMSNFDRYPTTSHSFTQQQEDTKNDIKLKVEEIADKKSFPPSEKVTRGYYVAADIPPSASTFQWPDFCDKCGDYIRGQEDEHFQGGNQCTRILSLKQKGIKVQCKLCEKDDHIVDACKLLCSFCLRCWCWGHTDSMHATAPEKFIIHLKRKYNMQRAAFHPGSGSKKHTLPRNYFTTSQCVYKGSKEELVNVAKRMLPQGVFEPWRHPDFDKCNPIPINYD